MALPVYGQRKCFRFAILDQRAVKVVGAVVVAVVKAIVIVLVGSEVVVEAIVVVGAFGAVIVVGAVLVAVVEAIETHLPHSY